MSRAKDNITYFFDNHVYFPTRTLYIGSGQYGIDEETGVDGKLAEDIIKAIHVLDSEKHGDFNIILNCIGGDTSHGFAIIDKIKSCKNYVTTTVFGVAHSMGAAILQAADKRIMAPSSRLMIHHGDLDISGESSKVYANIQENKIYDDLYESLLYSKIKEKHPKFAKSKLKEMLKTDTFLSAKQATELGLADEVMEF